MPKAWPSAVLVDLDNTLHDYKTAARSVRLGLARLVEGTFGIPREVVLERYQNLIAREEDATCASGHALRLARMRVLLDTWPESHHAQAEPFADFIGSALLDAVRPFDGAIEAYHALDSVGPTIVLTEGYADTQAAIVHRLGLSLGPEKLLATKIHAVRKRDGSAFRLACERLDISAENIVMVGDNWTWDILGAAMAGMWQVWVAADAEDNRRGDPPERFLGRVAAFRQFPGFLAARWERRNIGASPPSGGPPSDAFPFEDAYSAARQHLTVSEDDRAVTAVLRSEIEDFFTREIQESGFGAKYPVRHVMNVGSTSRGTYAAFPADFDIVIDTACEQTRIAHDDARQLCGTVIEKVMQTEAFWRFAHAIGSKTGLDNFSPRVELTSFGVRGPQSLVARYSLVEPSSATDAFRIGFLDVSFGLLPQLIGYEIAIRRLFESLGPLSAERLRSEIRLAKSLLKHLGGLYGSAARGLRAHAVEQWVIQSLNYRDSGLIMGTLENALRLIVEERRTVGFGSNAESGEFQKYKARFPLLHPGWQEIAGAQSNRRNINLWDLLGDGEPALAEEKWRKLVALALAFERLRAREEVWDLKTLAQLAEVILPDNTTAI